MGKSDLVQLARSVPTLAACKAAFIHRNAQVGNSGEMGVYHQHITDVAVERVEFSVRQDKSSLQIMQYKLFRVAFNSIHQLEV